jgi:hypothetical protein
LELSPDLKSEDASETVAREDTWAQTQVFVQRFYKRGREFF